MGQIQFIGQIDMLKNYLYSIGPCAKKKKRKLKKQLHENVNLNV